MGGTGLGSGTFETAAGHQIIPYLNTDFIYSALAQELGLIGASGLILLYMVFVLRGFRIALFAGDGFSKLLAAGLTFGFALQTFIIVGGILRVIPLTGHHAAARLVRRLEHRRELPRARGADARLEPRESRAGGCAMNRQLNRLAIVAVVAARRARRRDDVLADVGVGRAAGPAGQRDPARRAVHGRARPHRGRRREDGVRVEPQEEAERRDVVLPPLPPAQARRADDRLLDAVALAGRPRALDERLPHRREHEPVGRLPAGARQDRERDRARQQPRPDDQAEGAAARREPARRRAAAPSSR